MIIPKQIYNLPSHPMTVQEMIDIILVIEDSINAPKKVRGTTVLCNM